MQELDEAGFANRISSGLDFNEMLTRMLQQNGYTSDNSKKGLRSALKDYDAVFHKEPPKWLSLIWPSTAMSLVHLSLAKKTSLPDTVNLPQCALKNGL